MAAAKDWGIAWDEWMMKNPVMRAEMVAFYLFSSKYESYMMQYRNKSSKKKDRSGQKAYEQMDLALR